MPKYVILRHECPPSYTRPSHWDLMLRWGPTPGTATLRTWAIVQSPDRPEATDAERLGDHRLEYLEFEGPLSGDRGTVSRWDTGSYSIVESGDDALIVEVQGQRLHGRVLLNRVSTDSTIWRYWYQAE